MDLNKKISTSHNTDDIIHKLPAAHWDKAKKEYGVPYFPDVTMGWDPTTRCDIESIPMDHASLTSIAGTNGLREVILSRI